MDYTKGEWEALDNNCVVSGSGFDTSVIVCCGNTEEAEANAHLIAAAPDMYEALKDMVNWYIKQGFDRELPEFRAMQQALAKKEEK